MSRKPAVATIQKWEVCHDQVHTDWDGKQFHVKLQESKVPFYGYIKLEYKPVGGRKITKYWYGENSSSDAARFVNDLCGAWINIY